jgi:hypothetical protein
MEGDEFTLNSSSKEEFVPPQDEGLNEPQKRCTKRKAPKRMQIMVL